MRIAIIGAGITGISTAYELAADGHAVSVFERRGAIAAESSFGNAGLLSPGWLMQTLAQGQLARPIHWDGMLSRVRSLPWMWRRWQATRGPEQEERRQAQDALARFSLQRMKMLRRDLQLDYERTEGLLLLLRGHAELSAAKATSELLEKSGMAHRWLEPSDCLRLEPGLNAEAPLVAGLHFPHDESGNCREFAILLKQAAQRMGVKFRFHTTVRHIEAGRAPTLTHEYTPPEDAPTPPSTLERNASDGPITAPMLHGAEQESFDAIVLCTALDDGGLLRRHGMRLTALPLMGYSLTAPLRQLEAHPDLGPRSALIDTHLGISMARLGQRVRIAGGMTPSFRANKPAGPSIARLHQAMHDWFPGALQASQTQVWQGRYPLLPDGAPLLGNTPTAGIWLNLAPGEHGWGLAAGSARWLADQISGRPHAASSALSLDSLRVERLR